MLYPIVGDAHSIFCEAANESFLSCFRMNHQPKVKWKRRFLLFAMARYFTILNFTNWAIVSEALCADVGNESVMHVPLMSILMKVTRDGGTEAF